MAREQKTNKTVAVLVFPGVSMLELTVAYSTLNGLAMAKYGISIVAMSKDPVPSDTPLKVVPHKTIAELPQPDILAVMGVGSSTMQVIGEQVVREYVLAAAQTAEYVIGYGTGSVVLAACGLLKDRQAASHWAFSGLLEAFGVRYVQKRWIEDGKYITTAGGTAPMDMGLGLLARLVGEKNARMLQMFAEYDPQPPFGGINWSQLGGNGRATFPDEELAALERSVADQPAILEAVYAWTEHLAPPLPTQNAVHPVEN